MLAGKIGFTTDVNRKKLIVENIILWFKGRSCSFPFVNFRWGNLVNENKRNQISIRAYNDSWDLYEEGKLFKYLNDYACDEVSCCSK